MINVMGFTDYRAYLKAYQLDMRSRNAKFTQRFIELKLGLKSSGHFTQILQGKVNISNLLIVKITSLIGLQAEEAEYFETLVLFNQSRSKEESERYLEKLKGFWRRTRSLKTLERTQHSVLGKWYSGALRECLEMLGFKGDFAKLARSVIPPITDEEARQAVQEMLELGLVRVLAGKRLGKSDHILTADCSAGTRELRKHQAEMFALAVEAWDRFPAEARDGFTLTIGLDSKDYPLIREEFKAFRNRLVEICGKSGKPDRVYHLGFVSFPLGMADPLLPIR